MQTRALVLGGGGPVGIAWESGVLAGMAECGVDLSQADFICGTSAGSFVGARLALGNTPASIAATYLTEEPAASSAPQPSLGRLIVKMMTGAMGNRPPEKVRAELGAWALHAKTISEETFLERFASVDARWPERDFVCTAVDTANGEFIVWKRDSGIGLARAVASSCSVPSIYPPVSFQGRRYMDGGMRTATNADVAKGHGLVVVLALAVAVPAFVARPLQARLEKELQTLRDSGSRVELILPDSNCKRAFGFNLMDARRRPAAAKAGLQQGRGEAARLRTRWEQV
jgi:NTE family protein